MERFSRPCQSARAAANSCCPCCCSRFPFLPCWAWSQALQAFLRERIPRTSISYCFSPTMWCLLQRVSACLTRYCKRNEEGVPHPRGADGTVPGLCFLPGDVHCAYRLRAGRRLPHHLLPRALGVDSLPAVLHQLHRFGAISGERETVIAARRKVDCDHGRDCWLHCAFYSAGEATTADRDVPQFGRDHSVDPCRPLFPDRKMFSGAGA